MSSLLGAGPQLFSNIWRGGPLRRWWALGEIFKIQNHRSYDGKSIRWPAQGSQEPTCFMWLLMSLDMLLVCLIYRGEFEFEILSVDVLVNVSHNPLCFCLSLLINKSCKRRNLWQDQAENLFSLAVCFANLPVWKSKSKHVNNIDDKLSSQLPVLLQRGWSV